MIPYRATLDVERAFVLTPTAIVELEKATGVGIGSLIQRLPTQHFGYREIVETLKFGLIGAGTPEDDAASIVAAFMSANPLSTSWSIATDLLVSLYAGPAIEQEPTNA